MQTILIIEDNKYLQFALLSILEDAGYEVVTAMDSIKAMTVFLNIKPDLVFLDKKLLDCDSFELLSQFKKLNNLIPVVMLTAYADDITKEEALKLGANVFMTKPFDNDDIISTVKNLLKPVRSKKIKKAV